MYQNISGDIFWLLNSFQVFMQLISWKPFHNLDRMFEEEFSSPLLKSGWDLATDVYEEGDKVIAEMTLPAVDANKLEISVQEGYLRVSGSREETKEEKKKNYHSKEIKRGNFERVARLPAEVVAEKAVATYKNGLLKVVFPKKNGGKSSQVNIKVAT